MGLLCVQRLVGADAQHQITATHVFRSLIQQFVGYFFYVRVNQVVCDLNKVNVFLRLLCFLLLVHLSGLLQKIIEEGYLDQLFDIAQNFFF